MSGYANNSIFWVDTSKIAPNPFQPRREFNEHALHDLADSIRQYGVLQPLVVTRVESYKPDGGMEVSYELIAGERRLRASQIAQLQQVPVIIRSETDNKVKLELAIIENLQREDLNAIDRALAFDQLHREFNLTHAEIGKRMGKSRVYVSNSLRLLALPDEIKKSLMEGHITEGHTRPLLMLIDRPEEQLTLFKEILSKNLSVRDAEKIARRVAQDKIRKKEFMIDPRIRDYELKISENLGTRVQIEQGEKGGKIVIDYFSQQDLDKLIHSLIHDGIDSLTTPSSSASFALNSDTPSTYTSGNQENYSNSYDADYTNSYTDSYSKESSEQQYAREDLAKSTGLDFYQDAPQQKDELSTDVPDELAPSSYLSGNPYKVPELEIKQELLLEEPSSQQEETVFQPAQDLVDLNLQGTREFTETILDSVNPIQEFTPEPVNETLQKAEEFQQNEVITQPEIATTETIVENFERIQEFQQDQAVQPSQQSQPPDYYSQAASQQNTYQEPIVAGDEYYQQQALQDQSYQQQGQLYQQNQPYQSGQPVYYPNQGALPPRKKGFLERLFG
jgi:ParB family chromosome partitioning protein